MQGIVERTDDEGRVIEQIMDHRIVTVQSPDSPNSQQSDDDGMLQDDPSDKPAVIEYLIKWKGWSHRHNSWETIEGLAKYKGLKKVENYRKLLEQQANEDDGEWVDIKKEMRQNYLKDLCAVERIIASRQVDPSSHNPHGGTEYLCKWKHLEYEHATWEPEADIQKEFQADIDAFLARQQNNFGPHKSVQYPKGRPEFKKFDQPDYIQGGDLRDYQIIGVNWMAYLWHRNENGILADEMGLGKTVQAISFMTYLFNSMQVYGPFLIVVPLSTISSWQKELGHWAPYFNTVVYLGSANSKQIIRDHEFYMPIKTKEPRLKFNVLLTTYEGILNDKGELGNIRWAFLGVDEAHRLKNQDSQLHQVLNQYHTGSRLLITGTPLQNTVKELVALVQFLMPDKFSEFADFDITVGQEGQEERINELQSKLKDHMLRRLKKDVEKSMPTKTERILRVDLSPMQLNFYKAIFTKNFTLLSRGVNDKSFLRNILVELKKASNHPYLFDGAEPRDQSPEEQLRGLIMNSGKMVLLDKLLVRLREGGHRVLIFSQMVRMLDILSDYLTFRHYPFQRLDGSIPSERRKIAMEQFNAPNSVDFAFLLSTRAGGLGLNLETADTVIIFDSDWNPQNDLQAMARAHRIGQKKTVNIYRFVSKDTVEEEVLERAKRKMVLEYCIIKQMDTSGETLIDKSHVSKKDETSKEELQTILRFGAQNLFKQHSEEGEEGAQGPSNKLEEMNLDEILSRAEHQVTEGEAQGATEGSAEFLEQWRVADVEVNQLNWDDIIPEQERRQAIAAEEEERRKAELEMLIPRQARVQGMTYINDGVDGADDDDDQSKKRKRRSASGAKKKAKRSSGTESDATTLTEKDVRALYKALLRFGDVEERYDDIAKDAELEDKDPEFVTATLNRLIDACIEALGFTGTDRDPTLKTKSKMVPVTFEGVSPINAGQVVQRVRDLTTLNQRMKEIKNHDGFRLNSEIKPVRDWKCTWLPKDDAMLLVGIYRHGFGSWDLIQQDSSLGFKHKFFLSTSGEDETAAQNGNEKGEKNLPKSLHLQRRGEYLLKVLKEEQELRKLVRSDGPARKAAATAKRPSLSSKIRAKGDVEASPNGSADKPGDKNSRKRHPRAERTPSKDSQNRARRRDTDGGPVSNADASMSEATGSSRAGKPSAGRRSDSESDGSSLSESMDELECKEIMRPVRAELKGLNKKSNDLSRQQKALFIKTCMGKIGGHIEEVIRAIADGKLRAARERHLWKFASWFWPTTISAEKFRELYLKVAASTPTVASLPEPVASASAHANANPNAKANANPNPNVNSNANANTGNDDRTDDSKRSERAVVPDSPALPKKREAERKTDAEQPKNTAVVTIKERNPDDIKRKRERERSPDRSSKSRQKPRHRPSRSRSRSRSPHRRSSDGGRRRSRSRERSTDRKSESRRRERSRSAERTRRDSAHTPVKTTAKDGKGDAGKDIHSHNDHQSSTPEHHRSSSAADHGDAAKAHDDGKDKSRSKEKDRERDRERDRDRDRDRDHRDRDHRERDRERDREHKEKDSHRDRDRDSHREKDRGDSHRDKDRDREKTRDRDRPRDRDREKSSHERDRDRARDKDRDREKDRDRAKDREREKEHHRNRDRDEKGKDNKDSEKGPDQERSRDRA
ncbi:SNF2 family N-terminal domain-containing protein [Polychytrium aggregatum]|uniref:SNF2 family N-terminal domain-containing protein n=1 Tax=Polychytrium aggregatum TaxID=110093 RepID=UPI0022FDF005|nr:SNF2 family N-terminal domain-containing protein [Polychytrium aggregatum]KAI9203088.1 SNF2 family N-terminal domain-containing protein [Polychytrium aggregatum]